MRKAIIEKTGKAESKYGKQEKWKKGRVEVWRNIESQ